MPKSQITNKLGKQDIIFLKNFQTQPQHTTL